jgi:hypothetical protein
MAVPTRMKLTPQATITIAEGHTTDTASEFWQRISTTLFKVYENVPNDLCRNIQQDNDPDTAIRVQLAGYPWRVST